MIDNKNFEKNLNETIKEFTSEIFQDPFKYYGEMEMHFYFCELWIQKTKLNRSIFRAYPTNQLYENVNGYLEKDFGKTRGYIDICLKNENDNYGIEMYIGRDSDKGFLQLNNGNTYCLKEKDFTFKEFKPHLDYDIIKLTEPKNNISKGYLIYLIRGWRNPNKRTITGKKVKHESFFQYINETESYFKKKINENNLMGVFMYVYYTEDMKKYEKMIIHEP